jgi:hypothetical protein
MPVACRHSPGFVVRHGLAMLTHTFAGSTVRSALGLESQRAVFERFRERRRQQRAAATSVDVRSSEEVTREERSRVLPTVLRGGETEVRQGAESGAAR